MDIDITSFFESAEASQFNASAAELGQNAGKITWDNARRQAAATPLLATPEALDAMRDFAHASGGWNAAEVAAWSADEVNALFIQWVSGDIREIKGLCTDDNDGEINWMTVEEMQADGTIASNIYRATDGRIFFSLDS